MATKKKIFRKKLKEPDEFVSTTTQILEYVSDNWKGFVAGGVVCLLIIGGVFFWRASKAKNERRAFALYHVIQQKARVPEKTDNAAVVKACGGWDKLKKDFPGTAAAMYGTLQEAACFIGGRAYQKGVSKADSLLRDTTVPAVVRVLALFLKGCGLEEKKAYGPAEAVFQTLLKEPENFLKDTTRYHLYFCQLNKGDRDKARKTLAGFKLEAGSDFPFPPILIKIDKSRLGLENKS